jgi:hypothetical protein
MLAAPATLGAARGAATAGSFCKSGQLITPSSVSNCENRLRVIFQAMKAIAPSTASPPATDSPTMVLVETPPPLLSCEGGALDGVGVELSVMEMITSVKRVVTSPFSCVLSICVLLAVVRTICDTEVGVLVGVVVLGGGGVEGGSEVVEGGGVVVVDGGGGVDA